MSLSDKSPAAHPGFIFVGKHPAIDFANTLSMSQGQVDGSAKPRTPNPKLRMGIHHRGTEHSKFGMD